MNSERAWVTGAAFSVVVGLVYLVCAIAVVLFPDGTVSFINGWTHGIDLSLIKRPAAQAISLSGWITGLLTASVSAFIAGTLFGWLRNAFARMANASR